MPKSGKTKPTIKLPLANYLNEVRIELKKVTWPGRQQVIKLSSVVIGVSVVTGIYTGLLDWGFTWLVSFLINS